MQDAQSVSARAEFLALHGAAIVGHHGSGQGALLQRLAKPMDQRLGGLLKILLQMTDQTGVSVENTQSQGRDPVPRGTQHFTRAVMEVAMPETMDILGLEAAHFPLCQLSPAI